MGIVAPILLEAFSRLMLSNMAKAIQGARMEVDTLQLPWLAAAPVAAWCQGIGGASLSA